MITKLATNSCGGQITMLQQPNFAKLDQQHDCDLPSEPQQSVQSFHFQTFVEAPLRNTPTSGVTTQLAPRGEFPSIRATQRTSGPWGCLRIEHARNQLLKRCSLRDKLLVFQCMAISMTNILCHLVWTYVCNDIE